MLRRVLFGDMKCPPNDVKQLLPDRKTNEVLMKKLLIGLMAVSSLGAFAQETRSMTVTNLTYPDQQMIIECADDACSELIVNKAYTIEMSKIDATIRNRRGYYDNSQVYSLTSESSANVERDIDEGYYERAVGNSLVTVGAAVVDTAILIPQVVVNALSTKVDSRRDKKGAKRIKNNILSDIQDVVVKERWYVEMKKYLADNTELMKVDKTKDIYSCRVGYDYGHDRDIYFNAESVSEADNACVMIGQLNRGLGYSVKRMDPEDLPRSVMYK